MKWVRVCALLSAALVPWLQMRIDQHLGSFRATEEVLYVWSGEHWRRLLPGLENVMSDLYWLRTIQYFGGVRAFDKNKRYDLLSPMIEISVALDPRFEMAYRYGATFLCDAGGASRPDLGVALLERGVKALPDAWLLHQNLGFFTYFYLHDADRAAQQLLTASERPGAPTWLRQLAADLLAKGGEIEKSRRIWQRILETSEGALRDNAHTNLLRLDAEDLIQTWQAVVVRFQAHYKRYPATLDTLRLWVPNLPGVDPLGTPLDYDSTTGVVRLSHKSLLWRGQLDDDWAVKDKRAVDDAFEESRRPTPSPAP